MLVPYIKKYTKLNLRRTLYTLGKMFKYDPLNGAQNKLLREAGNVSREELLDLMNEAMVKSFLSPDIDEAIELLRENATFMEELKVTAKHTCDKKLLILGRLITETYDEKTGHYRWHRDLFADYDYVLSHHSQVRKKNTVPGVDIKNVWELSRMQYLFAPALLFRITGEEQYADFVCSVIRDWVTCNPCEEGPNWNIAMEAGIRVANIMLAFQLVRNSLAADDDFCYMILLSAYQHMHFILGNEENVGGRTSNHYLGGLLGVLSVISTFPFLPGASKNLKYVVSAFEHEIRKQMLTDGGDFEGSTSYQRLVGEMFTLAAIICKNAGVALSSEYKARLLSAANFTIDITKPNGRVSQIGDNDGGRIFVLKNQDNLNHSEFINLAYWVVTGKSFNAERNTEIMCFTGVMARSAEIRENQGITIFPESRLAIYRSDDLYGILSAVDAHRFGMGGHTHNDKLSFELMVEGKDFIVDPGTGVYTARPDVRNKLRSVTSHSTLQVNKREQNYINEKVLFGMKYDCTTEISAEQCEPGVVTLIGKISAITKEADYEHMRKLVFNEHNRHVEIIDNVFGCVERLDWHFVLHPDVHVSVRENTAQLTNGHVTIYLQAPMKIDIIAGCYSDVYGHWQNTRILWASALGTTETSKEYSFRIDL